MPKKRSWWEERKRRVKQLAAGFIESTVANSAEKGYRPALLDNVAAVPAIVGMLVNRRKDGKPFSGDTIAERAANASLKGVERAAQRTNKFLGTTEPENTRETMLRVGGGLLVPAPKGATVARAVSKAPVGKKAVEAGKKVAKATPKPVKVAGKVAAEVTMPLRQTKAGTAAAVGSGVTALVDTVRDKTVDPTTGELYEGTVGPRVKKALGYDPDLPLFDQILAEEEVQEVDTELLEMERLLGETGVEVGDLDQEELQSLLNDPVHPLEEIKVEEEEKAFGYKEAAITIGAVLGGGAVAKYGRNFMRMRQAAATAPDNVPAFTGKKFRSSAGTGISKAKTALVQQDEPVRSLAAQYLGRDWAKEWGYEADAATNVALGSKVRDFYLTGRAPKTPMRTQRLAPLAEAYAKELDLDEQRLVSDALLAASALDDYRATGKLAALNYDADGNPMNPRQLEMLIQQVKSNPKYEKYFTSVQKSFDDLLKFKVLRGRDTMENYKALRERRPNYVVMNRNLETDADVSLVSRRYSANEDQGLGLARATDEHGGVQGTTGVGNPFDALFDEWANEIRRADLNDLRSKFLVDMDATGARNNQGMKIVEKAKVGTDKDNIHTVRVNGREEAFIVRDPDVSKALHLSPRASIKMLEALRQAKQNMTTGPLATPFNLFAATASPIYDASIAMLKREKGVKLGLLNRTLVGGYVGALRHASDEVKSGIALTLRENMIRENSWLKGIIGEQNLNKLTTVFENAYENSVKAEMDMLGITSHTMHGSPDPSQLISGLQDIAPHFKASSEALLRNDIARAAAAGDISLAKAAFLQSKSAFASARADTLARTYQMIIEAMHNGTRYNAFLANKGGNQSVNKLASDMRRLSADASQHGGNDAVNMTLGSAMYGNLAVQSLYEVFGKFGQNPMIKMGNWLTFLGTIAAMRYAAILTDPDAMEKDRKKTPTQKLMSITTFGGAEIFLDPITRLAASFIFPIMDHISGLNEGNPDPNFFSVMENWLEPSVDLDEGEKKTIQIGLWEAFKQNNPLDPEAIPLISATLAGMGIDPGMSRMTGQPSPIKEQQLTGLDEDVKRPDALVSGWTETMIASVFSTTGRSILQMADDLYRAHNASGDLSKSFNVARQRWIDNAAKRAGPFRPILFGQYENVESAADINFHLMKDREQGIEQAVKVFNKDYRAGGVTSTTNKQTVPVPMEPGEAPPEIAGTEAAYIGEMANQLNSKWLSKNKQVLNRLGKQVEKRSSFKLASSDPNYTGSREKDINIPVNELNEERRYQRMLMLNHTRRYEELISQRIGRPFTFDQYNPEEYLRPLAPKNQ